MEQFISTFVFFITRTMYDKLEAQVALDMETLFRDFMQDRERHSGYLQTRDNLFCLLVVKETIAFNGHPLSALDISQLHLAPSLVRQPLFENFMRKRIAENRYCLVTPYPSSDTQLAMLEGLGFQRDVMRMVYLQRATEFRGVDPATFGFVLKSDPNAVVRSYVNPLSKGVFLSWCSDGDWAYMEEGSTSTTPLFPRTVEEAQELLNLTSSVNLLRYRKLRALID